MDDAFTHHAWATLRLIDSCLALDPQQLDATVPGTYGSISDTMRHLVGGDSFYLTCIGSDEAPEVDTEQMDLVELRAAMEANAARWSAFLGESPSADRLILEIDPDDGFQRNATVGLRLAQALHHGTDHRSQICTALSTLGVALPSIDVWDFGSETGRSTETTPDP